MKKGERRQADEREALIARLESRTLLASDYPVLVGMAKKGACSLEMLRRQQHEAQQGPPAGRGAQTDGSAGTGDGDHDNRDGASGKKRKSHGRLSSAAYTGARDEMVMHQRFKPGDRCPGCERGNLYEKNSQELINLIARAPIDAIRYQLQRLRCSGCQKTYTADLPKGASRQKHHPSANAALVVSKYGLGTPSKRLETWQKYCGIPLPDATQFEMVRKVADCLEPVFAVMEELGANSKLIQLDDTSMTILSLLAENRQLKEGERYGMHVSGILAYHDSHPIYLYYLGRHHAGENLGRLLDKRDGTLPEPIQVNDGSSRNAKHRHQTIEAFCHAHSVRKFKDSRLAFPWQCDYIISCFREVFAHDRKTKGMSAEERLTYHREHTAPLLDQVYIFMVLLRDKKLVEPHSSLGRSINYMLKRWSGFTHFLHLPGVPLDNNIIERALKLIIRLRKNALFFKNEQGARIGSLLTSILATTTAAGQNPLDYLQAVQVHADDVKSHPHLWLPWCYRQRLARIALSKAVA